MSDESVILLHDTGGGDRRWPPGFGTMPVWVGPADLAERVAARLRQDGGLLPMLPTGAASVVLEPATMFTLRALRDARRLADAPEPAHDAPEPVRAAFYAAVKAETCAAELQRVAEQRKPSRIGEDFRLLADELTEAPAGEATEALRAGDEQTERLAPVAKNDGRKLPSLGPHDRQAYQLWLAGQKQSGIADVLNKEHGTTYAQGQVSRMIGRAKRHAEASGLAELIPGPAKPAKPIAPERLELGPRVDGRSRQQRPPRDPEES